MPRLSQSHTSRLWRRVKDHYRRRAGHEGARNSPRLHVHHSALSPQRCNAGTQAFPCHRFGGYIKRAYTEYYTRHHLLRRRRQGWGNSLAASTTPPRPLASIHHALSQPPSRGATSIGSTALDGSDAPLDGATQLSGGRRPHHFVNRGAPRDERRHALE